MKRFYCLASTGCFDILLYPLKNDCGYGHPDLHPYFLEKEQYQVSENDLEAFVEMIRHYFLDSYYTITFVEVF
jgi:hypothetical protein